MKKGKDVFKSKTLWMGLATIATGLGLFFSGEQELQELIITAIGAIFTLLRFVTEEPINL